MDKKFFERYTHQRNYGCRIREYIYQGIRHFSLENELIKVVLLLDKGTDIVELIHKPTDTDVLWHSFNGRRAPASYVPSKEQHGGNFLDFYPGGWQELFPLIGSGVNYRGGEIGVHGEVTMMPWDYKVLIDTPEEVSVKFWVHTMRTPYLLEKTLTLKTENPTVVVSETVTNLGSTKNYFMWGHHPAYGPMFLEEGCFIELPGSATGVTDTSDAGERAPLMLNQEFKWPNAPKRDGSFLDVSQVPSIGERFAMSFVLKDFNKGGYRLINPKKKLAVEINWDKNLFPYIWIWAPYGGLEDYPWYGRNYNLAIEPWSSFPDNLNDAIANNTAIGIDAEKTVSTTFTIAVIRI